MTCTFYIVDCRYFCTETLSLCKVLWTPNASRLSQTPLSEYKKMRSKIASLACSDLTSSRSATVYLVTHGTQESLWGSFKEHNTKQCYCHYATVYSLQLQSVNHHRRSTIFSVTFISQWSQFLHQKLTFPVNVRHWKRHSKSCWWIFPSM